jgi:hypothetical protein
MRRYGILFGFLCVLAVALAVSAQDTPKIDGTWDVTINNPQGVRTEQWVVRQDGEKLTGTVKTVKGELPLAGTLNGTTLRVEVTNGDMQFEIHASVVGDSMDGTIRMGKNEYLWRAKRAKSN